MINNKNREKIIHKLKDFSELRLWNQELNKTNPMSLLEKHKNPLVRFHEKQRREIILKLVGDVKERSVADVGCEEGYNAKRIINQCAKIYCIDIDDCLLKIAKETINNDKAEFIQSDAQDIKLPDNSVDIAISSHVLEHLPSPQKGFDELVRIVKPHGRIVINVPNEKVVLSVKRLMKQLHLEFFLGELNIGLAPGHLHIFDKKMLLNIIGNKAKIKKLRYNPPFYTNIFVILEPIGK